MPYAGRRSGQSFAAFAEGARLGMAQKQQAENAKLQQQQLELARQQQAGIDEYYKAQTDLTRKKFEAGQAADAQANASEQGMAAAEFGATSNSLHRMVKQDPRLKGLADMAAATAAQMRAQGADDKALLVHAAKSMQDINAEKDRLGRMDWTDRWRDQLHSGAFVKDSQTRETDQEMMQLADGVFQAVESGQMDVADGEQILSKRRDELSKRAALSRTYAMESERVRTALSSMIPAQGPGLALIEFATESAARGVPADKAVEDAMQQWKQVSGGASGAGGREPTSKDILDLAKELKADDLTNKMTMEQAYARAQSMLSPKAEAQGAGQGGGVPQIPGLSPEEAKSVAVYSSLVGTGVPEAQAKKLTEGWRKKNAAAPPTDTQRRDALRENLKAAGVAGADVEELIREAFPVKAKVRVNEPGTLEPLNVERRQQEFLSKFNKSVKPKQ